MTEKEKLTASLKKKIELGGFIKAMMTTPGYKEAFEPWIERTLSNYEKNGLVRVNVMTDKETHIFAGEYRGLKIAKNFFLKAVKDAERANEKLKELENGRERE